MRKDPDSAAVARAKSGDADAVGELFERHWPDAWRLARSMADSDAAADDIAQESLVRAVYRIASFRERASFRTWLHQIVVNEALSALRRSGRSRAVSDAESFAEGPTRPENTIAVAISLMADLAPEQRAVLVLHHCLDYTLAETAQILEIPLGTVQSRAARGLARLRTRLEARDDD